MIADSDIHQIKSKALEVSEMIKNLSHPDRLLMLCHLSKNALCVRELELTLGLSQSAISQHLGRLFDRGILRRKKHGKQVYYSVKDPRIQSVLENLIQTYC